MYKIHTHKDGYTWSWRIETINGCVVACDMGYPNEQAALDRAEQKARQLDIPIEKETNMQRVNIGTDMQRVNIGTNMQRVNIGTNEHTTVMVDNPHDDSGACHSYTIIAKEGQNEEFAAIDFQCGPVKESGVNGCHNEDLIAIVIHRLQGLQSGPCPSPFNNWAVSSLESALEALQRRTMDRKERGVEGTNKP